MHFEEVIEETGEKISYVGTFRFIGAKSAKLAVYRSGTLPWTVEMETDFREMKRLVVAAIDLYVMDVDGASNGTNQLYLLPDASGIAAGMGCFQRAPRPRVEELTAYGADRERLAKAALWGQTARSGKTRSSSDASNRTRAGAGAAHHALHSQQ